MNNEITKAKDRKNKRINIILVASIAILCVSSAVSCAKPVSGTTQNPLTLIIAPKVDALELFSEFQTDAQAAMSKYQGVTLEFPGVVVEQVPSIMAVMHVEGEYYVQTGLVKFRSELPDPIYNIRQGYIVDPPSGYTGPMEY